MKKIYYDVVLFENGQPVETLATLDNKTEAYKTLREFEEEDGDIRMFISEVEITKDMLRNIAMEYEESMKMHDEEWIKDAILGDFCVEMDEFNNDKELNEYTSILYRALKNEEAMPC